LKLLTAAGIITIALLASPMFVPLANGLPQQDSVKIISVSISGSTGTAQVLENGATYTITAEVSSSASDPTVTTPFGYADYPQYIGNPPYASWWNGISNPPEIYVYIDSDVAFNSGQGAGEVAGILGILAAATAGVAAGVAAAAVVLVGLDYSTIYGADHNADGSLSLWIPVDWFNYVVLFEGSHDLYVATPNYWWLSLPGLAIRSNR
jgi:hypothetical protein